jgi:hypothetical protein
MSTQLTVFGKVVEEGQKLSTFFDKDGTQVPSDAGAVLHLEFSVDEEHEPVITVIRGAEYTEWEEFIRDCGPEFPAGGLVGTEYRLFDGRVRLVRTYDMEHIRQNLPGEHYIFSLRRGKTEEEEERDELYRMYVESGE